MFNNDLQTNTYFNANKRKNSGQDARVPSELPFSYEAFKYSLEETSDVPNIIDILQVLGWKYTLLAAKAVQ